MANSAEVFRFSTRDWVGEDRFDRWREIVGRAVMRMEIDPGPDAAFRGGMVLQVLPGLGLAEGFCSTTSTRRTNQLIDDDDLTLNLVVDGLTELRQRGRQVSVRPGDAILTSSAEKAASKTPSVTRMKILRMPRAVLAPLVKDIDAAVMSFIPPQGQALRLLSGYVELIQKMGSTIDPEAAALAATHIHHLAALVIGTASDSDMQSRDYSIRAARLAVIKNDILKSATEPSLNIGAVAQRHRVSVRYVQMLLADAGTNFGEIVLGARLDAAYRTLSGPQPFDKPIAAVALDAGFSDLSYFNRTFRRRFGGSPGEIRAANQTTR